MEKRNSRFLVVLGSVAAVGLLLVAFLVVWLIPRGPESGEASGVTPPPAASSGGTSASTSAGQTGDSAKGTFSQAGGPSMAPVTDQAHISVSGTGTVSAKPDMATVQVGVQIQNPSLASAQTEAATKMDAIMQQLKGQGVEEKDIATSQFNVEPVMNYRDNQPPEVTGYRVTNIVSVKLRDLTKAGKLIDNLVESGANTLYGISFGFSNPNALMKQAREAAMKDAADKAGQLATLSGATLGSVLIVQDAGSSVPPTVIRAAGDMEKSMAAGAAPATQISTGEQEIRVDVSVTYGIK